MRCLSKLTIRWHLLARTWRPSRTSVVRCKRQIVVTKRALASYICSNTWAKTQQPSSINSFTSSPTRQACRPRNTMHPLSSRCKRKYRRALTPCRCSSQPSWVPCWSRSYGRCWPTSRLRTPTKTWRSLTLSLSFTRYAMHIIGEIRTSLRLARMMLWRYRGETRSRRTLCRSRWEIIYCMIGVTLFSCRIRLPICHRQ